MIKKETHYSKSKKACSVDVRLCEPADAQVIAQMSKELIRLHATKLPSEFRQGSQRSLVSWWARLLRRKDHRAWLAFENSSPLGFVAIFNVNRREGEALKSAECVLIHQIYVNHKFRRKGVGKALLQEVKKFAASINTNRIELDAWDFNQGASLFFSRYKFRPLYTRMMLAK